MVSDRIHSNHSGANKSFVPMDEDGWACINDELTILTARQLVHPTALPRAFFKSTLLDVSKHRAKQGCLMVNTVLELADADPELNQLATQKLNAIEDAFAASFLLAQKNGEMDTTYSAKELAKFVMTINVGLRIQSRQNKSREELESIIKHSLVAVGLAAWILLQI